MYLNSIIVLEKGVIVEKGNHNELIKNNGHYANLHEMQFAKIEWKTL